MRVEHKPKNERVFKKISRKVRNCFSNNKALLLTGAVGAGIFAAGIIADAAKPKIKNDIVCTCTQTMSCTRTVKEGDSLPNLAAGTSFAHVESVKVTKIDEKGIVADVGPFEVFMSEVASQKVRIPYGESLKLGEGVLIWEVKAEKGKNPGEAVVTVNSVSPCR